MMKKCKSRWLSILLAIVMVVGNFSAYPMNVVYAEEGTPMESPLAGDDEVLKEDSEEKAADEKVAESDIEKDEPEKESIELKLEAEKTPDEESVEPKAEPEKAADEESVEPKAESEKNADEESVEAKAELEKAVDEESVEPKAEPEKTPDEESVEPKAEPEKVADEESVEPKVEPEKAADEESVEPKAEPEKNADEESVEPKVEPEKAADEESVEPKVEPEKTSDEESVEPKAESEKNADEESVEPEKVSDEESAEPKVESESDVEKITEEAVKSEAEKSSAENSVAPEVEKVAEGPKIFGSMESPLSISAYLAEFKSGNINENDIIVVKGKVTNFENSKLDKVSLSDESNDNILIKFNRAKQPSDAKEKFKSLKKGDIVTLKGTRRKSTGTYHLNDNSIVEFKIDAGATGESGDGGSGSGESGSESGSDGGEDGDDSGGDSEVDPSKPMSIDQAYDNYTKGNDFWAIGFVAKFSNSGDYKVHLRDSLDHAGQDVDKDTEKEICLNRKSEKNTNLSSEDQKKLDDLKIGDKVTLKAKYGTSTYKVGYDSISEISIEQTKVRAIKSSLESGSVEKGSKLELSTETNSAEIYYTIDGTEPDDKSVLYSGKIIINDDMTLKAIAIDPAGKLESSDIISLSFTAVDSISLSDISDIRTESSGKAKIRGVVSFIRSEKNSEKKYVDVAYIQDSTGGIRVVLPSDHGVKKNNEIEVVGELEQFYNMSTINAIQKPNVLDDSEKLDVQEISLDNFIGNEEGYECELIEIENVHSTDDVDSYHNATLFDDANRSICVTSDEIKKNRDYDEIKGVVVYSYGKYRLIPRDEDDIDESDTLEPTKEYLNNSIISDADGAINVYFNKNVETKYAFDGNEASYNVNLEDRLLKRIKAANTSIDVATYEINLPEIVDALIEKASDGVRVRIVADAKKKTNDSHGERYLEMILNLEKMRRGKDGVFGTDDDIHMIADAPIDILDDKDLRKSFGLQESVDDLPDRYLVEGEKDGDGYRRPDDQMHNKFMIIDGSWVWTGSWNFTKTGLYGGEKEMRFDVLDGNTQNAVEINSSDVADIYTDEFEEMYGSSSAEPDSDNAKFHKRKEDNTAHKVKVGDTEIEIYFSVGDGAISKMEEYIRDSADYRVYFNIFSWSASKTSPGKDILEAIEDKVSSDSSFSFKGNIDSSFYSQDWAPPSIVNDTWGDYASRAEINKAREDRKLHSKTMIIDPNTDSDPTVIIGSTNWSNNGENVNDENMLFIHDADIANQFLQDFYGVVDRAGGDIPSKETMLTSAEIPDDVTFIHDVQGRSHLSPKLDEEVTIAAVVTGVLPTYDSAKRKYYNKAHLVVQEESSDWDSDDLTSEAIYIDARANDLDISSLGYGDVVVVKGLVKERVDEYDAGKSNKTNLTMTMIEASSIERASKGTKSDLPLPIVIGDGGRVLVADEAYSESVSDLTQSTEVLKPAVNAIDFYEAMEGMRVSIENPQIVGVTEKYGNMTVVPNKGKLIDAGHLTAHGGIKGEVAKPVLYPIILDDEMGELIDYREKTFKGINPRVGDWIDGTLNGVMLYSRGRYKVYHYGMDEFDGKINEGPARREVTDLVGAEKDLTIASYNIENFSGKASNDKVKAVAESITRNLKSPDIIGLIEVQDNDGQDDSGTSEANETYEKLIRGIVSEGGIAYNYVQIDPVDKMEGGAPGSNIRVGYLYNPKRVQLGESSLNEVGGSRDEAALVKSDDRVMLEKNPSRIGADFGSSTPFKSTRRSLVTDFTFRGDHVFVVANHFSSKRGDTGEFGRTQPATKASEARRIEQAEIVYNFVDDLLEKDENAKVVLLGDMNDYEDSRTLEALCGSKLKNLHEKLELKERYSYVHEGVSQVLDNILVSESLEGKAEIDVVHINAEFTHSDGRASDHDPVIARFSNLGKDDFVVVSPTEVSIDSGKIKDGQEVVFTSDEGSEIYYTLDGSVPTEKSLSANGNRLSIEIEKNIVVKTIVIKDGHKSAVMTYRYELKAGVMSISEAKTTKEEVTLEGIVTHDVKAFGGSNIYFEDETGGLLIHLNRGDKLDSKIVQGSKIRVEGKMTSYKGKQQFAYTKLPVWLEDTSDVRATNVEFNDLGKKYDSRLIGLKGLVIKAMNDDKYKNTYLELESGKKTLKVKIDARCGDAFDKFKYKVGDVVEVRGLLDINDYGMRLNPRNFSDIRESENKVEVLSNVNITVYQNYMPSLPKKVKVRDGSGKVKMMNVKWKLADYNLSKLGRQRVVGVIEEIALEIEAIVNVVPYNYQPSVPTIVDQPSRPIQNQEINDLKKKIRESIKNLDDKEQKKALREELKHISKLSSKKKYEGNNVVNYEVSVQSLQTLLDNVKKIEETMEETGDVNVEVKPFLTVKVDENDKSRTKKKVEVPKSIMKELREHDLDVLIDQEDMQFRLASDVTDREFEEIIFESEVVSDSDIENELKDGMELVSKVYDMDLQYVQNGSKAKLENFEREPEVIMPMPKDVLAEDIEVWVKDSGFKNVESIVYWVEAGEIHFNTPHFSEYAVVKTVKEFSDMKIVEPDKIWTIVLSGGTDDKCIDDSSVFVVDENHEKVEVEYYLEGRNVYVIPARNYEPGEEYTLYVKGLKNSRGKELKQDFKLRFEIK
ncbi:MAG: phospholipase D-like domain-containing protein [Tissierellales bacterium]|nr:phospholipase D-like domain-containing protein [Tissierellales bacterium]